MVLTLFMMVLVKKTFKGSIETLKIRGMMVAFGNASGPMLTPSMSKKILTKRFILQDHLLLIIP